MELTTTELTAVADWLREMVDANADVADPIAERAILAIRTLVNEGEPITVREA